MSRVDVIIPCYKYAHFLPGCVESVLTQPADVRVLIIDDASPDDTQAVAAALAAADPRVEYRRHSVNQRHIATYNEGLEWASGDYVLLLSADDLLAPGALGRAVRLLDTHPEVGFAYGSHIKFRTGAPIPVPRSASSDCAWRIVAGPDWLEAVCREGNPCIASPECITRTSLQHQLGGYRKELPHSGDVEMWLRFAAHASVGVLEADQAYYRIHGENMHLRDFGMVIADLEHRKAAFDTLFREYGSRLPSPGLSRLLNEALAREALWAGCRGFDARSASRDAIQELIRFAIRTCPGADGLREYSRLQWRLRLGHGAWSLVGSLRRRSARAIPSSSSAA